MGNKVPAERERGCVCVCYRCGGLGVKGQANCTALVCFSTGAQP